MALKTETSIVYTNDISFKVGHFIFPGRLFRRRDRYENGSISDYYGVEVNKDHFMELKEDAGRKGKLREADGG